MSAPTLTPSSPHDHPPVSALEPTTGALSQRLVTLREITRLGSDRLPPPLLDQITKVVDQAGQRMRLSAGHTVVALAGATGSGKSSLFNALTGQDLATVGVRRPTTSTTSAAVWGSASAATPLLDWLGVGTRHVVQQEENDWSALILLDLPDHDSQALSHRMEVDRLVDMVDLLIWVSDPQKYADAAMHTAYLSPLAGHDTVTVVVLNQIDTLPADQARECLTDLSRLVREDGMVHATVLGTSARTGAGLEAMRTYVRDAVSRREAMSARISADIDRVAHTLRDQVPTPASATVKISRQGKQKLVNTWAQAAGVPTLARAAAGSYRRSAKAHTGWPVTRWLARFRPDPLRRWLSSPASQEGANPEQASASLPPSATSASVAASSVARSQVEMAVRELMDAHTKGLPAWQTQAMRRQLGADLSASDNNPQPAPAPGTQVINEIFVALQLVVGKTSTTLTRTPGWWRVFGSVQWALFAVTMLGLAWLAGLFVLAWLRLPEPPTPHVGVVPVPTVLLLGAVAAAWLVALLGRVLVGWAAARAERSVAAGLRKQITHIAETHLLAPLRTELDTYTRLAKRLHEVG